MVLHREESHWLDDHSSMSGSEVHELLRCCGCDVIKLRLTSSDTESDAVRIHYFPPAIFRRAPDWLLDLWLELKQDDSFVEVLLREIYFALQNNLPALATMGIRALLERIMISRVGDKGSFGKNLAEFERLGHVSSRQRQRLETILDAGHAAIHRAFVPNSSDVVTLLDIAEHVVESVFLHDSRVTELRKRVPPRGPAGAG